MAIYQEAKSGRPVNFPVNDWTRLSEALMSTWSYLVERQQKTYALRAAIFLSVGFATGANPGEWARATWADDKRTSVRFFAPTRDVAESSIFNSKSWNDKEQPNARYRDVKFDPTYQEHIQRHFYYLHQIFEGCHTKVQTDIAMGTYVKGCGKAILAARNKIAEWTGDPTRAYTLSVAQSQFPALQSLTDFIRQNEDLGWRGATTSAASQYGGSQDALRGHAVVTHPTNASA